MAKSKGMGSLHYSGSDGEPSSLERQLAADYAIPGDAAVRESSARQPNTSASSSQSVTATDGSAESTRVDTTAQLLAALQRNTAALESLSRKRRREDSSDSEGTPDDFSEGEVSFDGCAGDSRYDKIPLSETAKDYTSDGEDQAMSELLRQEYKEQIDNKFGPNIYEPVAKFLTNIILQQPRITEFKKTLAEVLVPRNMEILAGIRINDILYNALPLRAKQQDYKARWVNSILGKLIAPTAALLNTFLKVESQIPPNEDNKRFVQVGDYNFDVSQFRMDLHNLIKLQCQFFGIQNYRRRTELRPWLSKQFKSLTALATPMTTQLFGDNIHELIKNVEGASKTAVKYNNKLTSRRGHYAQQRFKRSKNFKTHPRAFQQQRSRGNAQRRNFRRSQGQQRSNQNGRRSQGQGQNTN